MAPATRPDSVRTGCESLARAGASANADVAQAASKRAATAGMLQRDGIRTPRGVVHVLDVGGSAAVQGRCDKIVPLPRSWPTHTLYGLVRTRFPHAVGPDNLSTPCHAGDIVGGMPEPRADVAAQYLENAARYATERDRQSRRYRYVSHARLVLFLGAAAFVLSAIPAGTAGAGIRVAAGVAGFVAFFALVYWHSRIDASQRWFATLALVNEEAAARVDRAWDRLSPASVTGPGTAHAYADDLDLFGHASLFQLLGWVGTEAGRQTLAGWLTAPAAPGVSRARQRAVAELARRAPFREELAALGRLVEPSSHDLDGFFRWAEGGPWLTRRRWLVWTVRTVSASTILLLAMQIAGLVDRPFWFYPLLPSLALFGLYERRIQATFRQAFSRDRQLQQHSTIFTRLAAGSFTSPALQRLQEDLRQSGATAAREMARLAAIRQLADLRFVQLFHFVIGLLTLWDFHVLVWLERWQVRNAAHLRRWFGALGEFDALAALAALAHDNPAWAFPEVLDQGARVEARSLGHPLIPALRRVHNDVTVGPPGSFLLVTGSNMSGKSTLLRAIGLNVVLAQAGGPVCAAAMTLPPVSVYTSMRVQDSLEEGVSYFMAALQRLRFVVSAARSSGPRDSVLLYLLDEVLQGTNTAERQVAVRRILRHLLTLRAIGAVTTHDLELASSEELAAACRPVHFTEGVEVVAGPPGQAHREVRLSFDYQLRPGVATSSNALKLLQVMGLDE
jgi:hypothetical protein